MAWLIVDAATAESIRKTPICPGQQFDPIPLKDGTFYVGDHPAIKSADRAVATVVATTQDFTSTIVPKQNTSASLNQAAASVSVDMK